MSGKIDQEDHQGECSDNIIQSTTTTTTTNNILDYQQQHHHLLLQQQNHHHNPMMMHHHHHNDLDHTFSGAVFPEVQVPPILPWSLPPVHPFNHPAREPDPFLLPPPLPPPPPPQSYGGFFNRRSAAPSLQFAYEGGPSSDHHHHLRILSDALVGSVVQPGAAPFGLQLQTELGKMSAQEIMDAKALAASKSHSEAERRRRERINNHLARLRSLLPSTTKTDKASLLAEVIQHVKELKRQTSLIAETSPIPTELDELTVDTSDEDGKFVIKASVCCEDRSDLLPDLIKTLKALRLRTLKAEITTLGGRVKNVLFVTGEEDSSSIIGNGDQQQQQQYYISSIQEALKAVIEKSGGDESSSASVKRQRTASINILEHRSL